MIYTIENPKGLDRVAQKLQVHLHDRLGWSPIDVYGITEKNFDKSGKPVLETYTSKNEYRDVLLNDNTKGSIFMIDDNSHKSVEGIRFSTELTLVFVLDLKKLFPTSTHRAKREAELQAIKVLREQPSFKFKSLDKGIKKSLGDFFYKELLAFDMHPYYTFSIVGEVNYSVSCLID